MENANLLESSFLLNYSIASRTRNLKLKTIIKWLINSGFHISNTSNGKVTELVNDVEYVYVDNKIKSDIGDIFIHPKHKNKQSLFNLVSGIIIRKDINLHSGLTRFPKDGDSTQHKGIKYSFSHKQAFEDFLLIFLDNPHISEEKIITQLEQSNSGLIRNVISENLCIDEIIWQQIKTRRGQSEFRKNLLLAYDGKCCITTCHVESVLEAAHIITHSEGSNYLISNGLLLRADIHTLYDLNLIGIDGKGKVNISESLHESEYWQFHGKIINNIPLEMSTNLAKRFELFKSPHLD